MGVGVHYFQTNPYNNNNNNDDDDNADDNQDDDNDDKDDNKDNDNDNTNKNKNENEKEDQKQQQQRRQRRCSSQHVMSASSDEIPFSLSLPRPLQASPVCEALQLASYSHAISP